MKTRITMSAIHDDALWEQACETIAKARGKKRADFSSEDYQAAGRQVSRIFAKYVMRVFPEHSEYLSSRAERARRMPQAVRDAGAAARKKVDGEIKKLKPLVAQVLKRGRLTSATDIRDFLVTNRKADVAGIKLKGRRGLNKVRAAMRH